MRLNASISALVQRDCAAAGEHSTIRKRDAAKRFADVVRQGRRRRRARAGRGRSGSGRCGTTPLAVSLPASARGHAKLLELAVQPVGDPVLVAVAEEGAIAVLGAGCADGRGGIGPGARRLAGNRASSRIGRPRAIPVTLVNTMRYEVASDFTSVDFAAVPASAYIAAMSDSALARHRAAPVAPDHGRQRCRSAATRRSPSRP